MITKNFGSFEVTGNFSLVNNNSNLLQTSLNDTTTITIDGREVLIIKGQTTLNLGTEQMTVDGDISTNIRRDAIAQRHFVIEIFFWGSKFFGRKSAWRAWDRITSKLNISGFSVNLTSLAITSAGLQIQGSITLPEILGEETVAIEDNNFIVINSGGLV